MAVLSMLGGLLVEFDDSKSNSAHDLAKAWSTGEKY